jgi:hypothetical protein
MAVARSMTVALRQSVVTASRESGEIEQPAQHLTHMAADLWRFIQEELAVVRQRRLTWHRDVPTADQPHRRAGAGYVHFSRASPSGARGRLLSARSPRPARPGTLPDSLCPSGHHEPDGGR